MSRSLSYASVLTTCTERELRTLRDGYQHDIPILERRVREGDFWFQGVDIRKRLQAERQMLVLVKQELTNRQVALRRVGRRGRPRSGDAHGTPQ